MKYEIIRINRFKDRCEVILEIEFMKKDFGTIDGKPSYIRSSQVSTLIFEPDISNDEIEKRVKEFIKRFRT